MSAPEDPKENKQQVEPPPVIVSGDRILFRMPDELRERVRSRPPGAPLPPEDEALLNAWLDQMAQHPWFRERGRLFHERQRQLAAARQEFDARFHRYVQASSEIDHAWRQRMERTWPAFVIAKARRDPHDPWTPEEEAALERWFQQQLRQAAAGSSQS